MVRAELDGWARDFAADHGCGHITVPFDRVVLRHLLRIEALLARGLTFSVLAHAITRVTFSGRVAEQRRTSDNVGAASAFSTLLRSASV